MPEQTDNLTKLISSVMNHNASDITVMYLAKIVKISPPTADIQPLAMINGNKANIVSKAHFIITPSEITYTDSDKGNKTKVKTNKVKLDYKVGDNVLVGCLDLDNMYFTNKDKFKVDSTRKHAVDFAVILGRYANKDDFKGGEN